MWLGPVLDEVCGRSYLFGVTAESPDANPARPGTWILGSHSEQTADLANRCHAAGLACGIVEVMSWARCPASAAVLMSAGAPEELAVVAELRARSQTQVVLVLSDQFQSEALEKGADGWLPLKASGATISALLSRIQGRSAPKLGVTAQGSTGLRTLLGTHPLMLQLQERATRVARTKATVLIKGESGVGKELLAESIHAASKRADGTLVRLNCAALSRLCP